MLLLPDKQGIFYVPLLKTKVEQDFTHLPVLPDKLGKVLTHYFFAIVCQNPESHMPAPCCTQTQDPNQPPAGRPIPASSGSEMRTCIPLLLLWRPQRRFKAQKSPPGATSTPTGLKRLKTQNTASYDCNTKWERLYLALPNLYTSANSFRKKNSSTLPILGCVDKKDTHWKWDSQVQKRFAFFFAAWFFLLNIPFLQEYVMPKNRL